MKRLTDLPPERQQEVVIRCLKAAVDRAKQEGLDGLPLLMVVFGPDPAIVVGTMPGDEIISALNYVKQLSIIRTEDKTPQAEGEG